MKYNRGFTLIELLVVIAIIGILSSIVMASVAGDRQRAHVAASVSFEHKLLQTAAGSAENTADYTFNSGSGTTAGDTFGHGPVATLSGNAAYVHDSPTQVGSSVLFTTADDSVTTPPQNLSGTVPPVGLTMGVWFKASTADTSGVIMSYGGFAMWDFSGGLILQFTVDNGTTESVFPSTSANINDGNWHYLTVTINDTIKESDMFIDGQPQLDSLFTYSGSLDALQGNNQLIIGSDGTNPAALGEMHDAFVSSVPMI